MTKILSVSIINLIQVVVNIFRWVLIIEIFVEQTSLPLFQWEETKITLYLFDHEISLYYNV